MTAISIQKVEAPAAKGIPLATWFGGGLALAFLVPFVFTSVWELNHDVYYAIYFCAVGLFLAAFIWQEHVSLRAILLANWAPSLGLGAVAAAFVVMNVLRNEDSTPHPSGLYFIFEIGWRGLLYGVVDAALLTAFPAAVALAAFGGHLRGLGNRLAFAALSLALTMAITAVYHLGYEQFRDDGVAAPEIGNSIISIPALATANPVGSVLAHGSMHIAAVTHAYETDTFLPPQTEAR